MHCHHNFAKNQLSALRVKSQKKKEKRKKNFPLIFKYCIVGFKMYQVYQLPIVICNGQNSLL